MATTNNYWFRVAMLQLERKATANKTKNFLALNKSSVRAKSKLEAARRKEREETELPKRKPRLNDTTNQKPEPIAPGTESSSRELPLQEKETVTISKDYLEQLLRQSLMKDQFHSLPSPDKLTLAATISDNQHVPRLHNKRSRGTSSSPTHVVVNHTQIPGLEGHSNDPMETYESRTDQQFIKEDIMPIVSQYSPRLSESYHRGTLNRPIHPAMRSNIMFGEANRTATSVWPQINLPTRDYHVKGNGRRKSEERNRKQSRHTPPLSVRLSDIPQCSPRSSMDLFQSQKLDENKTKELLYREELRLQIEEKKRQREEERLRREREDRREAERVELERQRLAREFEREKERQRRKEIEVSQQLAMLQKRTQMTRDSMNAAREKDRISKLKQPQIREDDTHKPTHNFHQQQQQLTEEDISLTVNQVEFDLRSPSMLQVTHGASPPPANKSPQKSPRDSKSLLVRKQAHGSSSQVSLHSTSSEEPTTHKLKSQHVGSKTSLSIKPGQHMGSIKMASGLVKETRVQRRHAIKKQMENNKSDSESEFQERFSRQRGNKPSGTISGGNRTLPNSIARSTKQALHRSLKEQNHNRTVRLREPNPLPSSPDCNVIQSRSTVHYRSPPPSPPVPAVARRLAQGQKTTIKPNDIHDPSVSDMATVNFPLERVQLQTSGHQKPAATADYSTATVPVLPSIPALTHIERAPSCSPDSQPIIVPSTQLHTSIPQLPPIFEVRSSQENQREEHSNSSRSQQQMLECLSKLKQNIVTHTQSVNGRVKNVLWNQAGHLS